eukprot:15452358-Alexandrium_andersonii.AAC.1
MVWGTVRHAAKGRELSRERDTRGVAARLACFPGSIAHRRHCGQATLIARRAWGAGVSGRFPTAAEARRMSACLRAVEQGKLGAPPTLQAPHLWAVVAGHRADLQAEAVWRTLSQLARWRRSRLVAGPMAELTLPSRLLSGISRAVSSWGLRPSLEYPGTWCDDAGRPIYCW